MTEIKNLALVDDDDIFVFLTKKNHPINQSC